MRRLLTALVATAVVASALAAAPAYAAAPSAPTDVRASGGYRSIEVSFRAPDDGGSEITRYEVRADDALPWRTVAVRPDGKSFRVTIRGLEDGTGYGPDVRAVNADGVSPPSQPSSEFSFATTFGPPTSLGTTGFFPQDRSLVFNNYNSRDTYTRGLPSEYRLVLDPVRKGLPTRRLLCDDPRCVVPGLRNGASYRLVLVPFKTYRVYDEQGALKRTYRFVGERGVKGTFVPWSGPQAPEGVSAEPAKQSAVLRWRTIYWDYEDAVRDFEVSVDGGAWQRLEADDGRSATVTGLEDGRTYSLRLRGLSPVDRAPGLPSAPVTVTPGSPG